MRDAALLLAASAGAVAAAVALTGVGTAPGASPERIPRASTLSASAESSVRGESAILRRNSRQRHAYKQTLRVRNVSCFGVATGSGFAIDDHTVVTNRHVLDDAAQLQLNTWNGQSMTADVSEARVGQLVDIGFMVTPKKLPAVARTGPEPHKGDPVTAVGFPLGGRLTMSQGKVVRFRDGRKLTRDIAFDGPVMEISAKVKHGNSGGPLLDSRGRVVGVIYAGEPGPTADSPARIAYAIPLSSMRTLLRRGGRRPVISC